MWLSGKCLWVQSPGPKQNKKTDEMVLYKFFNFLKKLNDQEDKQKKSPCFFYDVTTEKNLCLAASMTNVCKTSWEHP